MNQPHISRPSGHPPQGPCHQPPAPASIAFNEHELATRWGLSVKTLRRWRQQQLGPVFCKLGSRVVYLITDVEAFERRCSRYSTFTKVYA
jgi:hypothetical protein